MQSLPTDRRNNSQDVSFPLKDSNGHLVQADRRKGEDRRKNKRADEIVSEILDIIHS